MAETREVPIIHYKDYTIYKFHTHYYVPAIDRNAGWNNEFDTINLAKTAITNYINGDQ